MTRTILTGLGVLCLAASVACNRQAADGESTAEFGLDERPLMVTGCLRAQGEEFVLTELEYDAPPMPTTEMYQLEDADEELRMHVGRRVQIFGEAPPAAIAELPVPDGSERPVGTSGDDAGAQVDTAETARVAVQTLQVFSVIPSDESCDQPLR